MKNNLSVIRSRPGMYLSTYDKNFDASSICINFLIAIFDSLEFGSPEYIDITSTGPYFSVSAIGCGLTIEANQDINATSIFDISNSQQVSLSDTYPSLIYLEPMVWFSEYCLVDISINEKIHRQVFIDGSPISQSSESILEEEKSRIGFCFTLSESVFDKILLDSDRIKQSISRWKAIDFARGMAEDQEMPELQMSWCGQSKHNFSLRISNLSYDEALWDAQFAGSKEKLRSLVAAVRADIRAGKTSEMVFANDGTIVPGA